MTLKNQNTSWNVKTYNFNEGGGKIAANINVSKYKWYHQRKTGKINVFLVTKNLHK